MGSQFSTSTRTHGHGRDSLVIRLPHDGPNIRPDQMTFTFRTRFDANRIQQALQKVVRRHAILRTGFTNGLAPASQSFLQAEVPATAGLEDFRQYTDDAQREDRLATYLQDDAARPFDFRNPPLLRLVVFRWRSHRNTNLGDTDLANTELETLRILLTTPAGLLDEQSKCLLVDEWLTSFRQASDAISIKSDVDCPQGLANVFQHQETDAMRNFWKAQLAGHTSPTLIDTPLPVEQQARSGVLVQRERHLEPQEKEAIRNAHEQDNVSLETLAEVAVGYLLSRYTGSMQPVFGVGFSGRSGHLEDRNNIAGPLRTHLPMRLGLSLDTRVSKILEDTQLKHQALHELESCTPHCVADAIDWPPDQSLFGMAVETLPTDPMQELARVGAPHGANDFHVTTDPLRAFSIQVIEEPEPLLRLAFDSSVCTESFAGQLLEHLAVLITNLARYPDRVLGDIPMLSDAEQLPVARSQETLPAPGTVTATITERFAEQLARSPQANAVADGETSLRYAELDQQANAVAERLLAAGVKKGEFVGLCVERETRLVAGILGILKSGAAYLPLDPSYPVNRLQFMIEDAGARLVVVPEALRERLPEGDYECIDLPDASSLETAEAPVLPDLVTRSDPAYVLYTSGSTGQPKGVIVSHGNVTRLFDACQDWLQPGPDDVWTLFHSYAFDVSVWEMWGALFHGGRLEVVSYEQSRSPDQFWNMLKERNVTVLSQTPSAFQLLDHEDARHAERLPDLRKIVFGGEALEFPRLAGWIGRYGDQEPALINMYGITETTVHATYYRVSAADLNAGNGSVIGHPLPDLYFYLLDNEGRAVPAGVPGEIWVGGAGVAQGYLNRPELNAQRFQRDPRAEDPDARLYRSGDYARLLENGELAYLGRRDNEVKIRGFRIDIGEISGTLRRMPGVLDTAVVAQPGPNGMKRLIAYVVTSRKEPVSQDSIRSHLAATLPVHMIPAMVIQVPKIPLTANGKADVKALPVPGSETDPGPQSAPADKIKAPSSSSRNEAILMRIWREVLARKSVKANDDFFALGGDSILALDVVTRARRVGLDFSPAMLLSHPRLADLATRVRQRNAGDDPATASSSGNQRSITATQQWMLQHGPSRSNPDELNRVRQFSIATEIDDDHIEQAWLEVIDNNERLRTRYEQLPDGEWSALQSNTADAIEYSRIDLDHLERSIQDEAIHIITAELRHSLSIQSGLLVRVARFQCGGMDSSEVESDRLVVVLHQLAVDPQAWSNILLQVESAWQRLAGTEQSLFHPMDLPLAVQADDFPFAELDQEQLDRFPVAPDQVDDILPLSPIQQLYYSVANTHSDVGFDSQVFELEGDIDPELFNAAWQRLVSRHDVLRTVFVDEGLVRPRQAVLRHIAMDVEMLDWSELSEFEKQEKLKAFCNDERSRGFDLGNGPLTRLTLARTQDQRWMFIWSCHRLQLDGWSMPVLFDELGKIYDALKAGIQPGLAVAGSYRNFIAWLEMRDVNEYEAFWKEQLRGLDRGHLLTGNGGTMGGTGAGNSERSRHFIRSDVCLPKDLTRAIDKFARENRMTPSVLFQGAWSLLLAALTGSFDVTFGAAYSGRTAGIPESENTVGPFINDIPVRVHIHPTLQIADWIVALRDQQSGLTEFQNASPAEIHKWAQRSHAYRLFDTLLVFQNFAVGESGKRWGKHIKVRSIDSAVRTNYPVSVTVTPGVHYTINFCVDDEVLSRESTEAISLHFIAMLNSIVMDADIRVGALLERTPRLPRSPTTQRESARDQLKRSPGQASVGKLASRITADDTMDRVVEEIVCDVLDLDTINLRKNFFDLGAQSVSLLEIHGRLQDRINRHFPIITLFQYPTPSALAGFLRSADGNGEDQQGNDKSKDSANDSSNQPAVGADRARMMRRSRRSHPARPPGP